MWTTTRFTDEFINEFFETSTQRHNSFLSSKKLAIDIVDDDLNITLLVPGHSANTLELQYESDKIKVKSIDSETKNEDGTNSTKSSLIQDIDESLQIGKDWNGAKATATIKDGILYISIPKYEERKPKKLSIKVG